MTISSLCLRNGLDYGEITTYIIIFTTICLLCLQIYNKNFVTLILSSIILALIFYNNKPISCSGKIVKKEEVFSVIQLGSTKRELIIEGNKQEKLVCKPIKFLSPSEKHEQKRTYLILDDHFINNYDILAVKGVLYETSELEWHEGPSELHCPHLQWWSSCFSLRCSAQPVSGAFQKR